MLLPLVSGQVGDLRRAWAALALGLLLRLPLLLLLLPLHMFSKVLGLCCFTSLLSCSLLICRHWLEEARQRKLLLAWHLEASRWQAQ